MAFKRPKFRPEEEESLWMLTYADLVTLLFTFFVVLYSISNPDPLKIQLLSNYFSQENKMTFTELQQKIEEYIVDNQVEEQVAVKLTSKGVEISFKDKALFDIGKAEIKEKASPIIAEISEMLAYQEISDRKISVEGHTDSVPIKSEIFPSNWELSSARAANVVRFLVGRGLNSKRFESIGYADTRPVVEEVNGKRGLAVNRRVVVIISPESYHVDLNRQEISISQNSSKRSTTVKSKKITIPSAKEAPKIVPVKNKNPEKLLDDKELMRKYFIQGQEQFKKANYNEAILLWKRVLEIDPSHALSKSNISRAQEKLK